MTDQTPPPPQHVNLLFRLAIVAGGAFVITILAFTATLFGDARSPAAGLLQRNAGWLFGWEVAALVVLGIGGMVVDRRQTIRYAGSRPEVNESPAPAADAGDLSPKPVGEA